MPTDVEETVVVEDDGSNADEASITETAGEESAAVDILMGSAADGDADKKARARRQVEFYFADSNLPYDKFMWQLHTQNTEHWVPIESVASFKRMRQYSQGDNSVQWVAEALRASEYLEVDDSGSKVRRKTEVKEPKGHFERSIYAKGFETNETPNMQSELEDFFQGYGSTNAVRMRRDEDKTFKGSVFVEFTEPSGVEAFLKADPNPTWHGIELATMTKDAYCEMKIKEKGLTGQNADRKRENMMNKKGFNAFKIPASQGGLLGYVPGSTPVVAAAATTGDNKSKKEVYIEFLGKRLLVEKDESGHGKVKEEEIPFLRGSTLKFEGVGENFSWTDIKLPLKDVFDGKAPYIDYARGKNDGFVGFHKALSDEDILSVKKAVSKINGNEITWSQIAEDEEKKFHVRRAQSSARFAIRQLEEGSSKPQRGFGDRGGRLPRGGAVRGGRGSGGGRGRGGRGGRGGGRGGRRDNNTADTSTNGADTNEGENGNAGDKRKRAVEPDGGPDVGVRGVASPPVLQTTVKKTKTETGEVSTVTASES
ncbi:hypothetical protein D9757_009893 [Collybiopsis confluens]|uniref:Uncharacterized protein n=1 Tax=Collybiopsis confluens TaxID=2823264 RepID=A0A8H5GTM0_9AGAR|nr:hypothetical protein D9757_009893 [Collybiopsis confluens]